MTLNRPLLLIFAILTAFPLPGNGGYYSTAEMLKLCRSRVSGEFDQCLLYMQGVQDAIHYLHVIGDFRGICLPKDLTPAQLIRMFIIEAEYNPAELNSAATHTLLKRLYRNFSCRQ